MLLFLCWTHEAYSNRACLSVCLSALALKHGKESAGDKCNIDITLKSLELDGLIILFLN